MTELELGHDKSDWQVWSTFSVNDIPDDIQAEIMAIGQEDHARQFRLGRIVVMLRAGLESKRLVVPAMRLYKAVAALAGCSSEHVRQCYQVAKNVPPRLEQRYPEIGFHQWRALVPHGDGDEAKLAHLVEGWLDHCAKTGISITSVDGIRGWLGSPGRIDMAGRYRSLVRMLERMVGDRAVPEEVKAVLRDTIARLEKVAPAAWRPQ